MNPGMFKTLLKIVFFRKERQKALRREHNDALYFMRHGRAPVFTHPDEFTD